MRPFFSLICYFTSENIIMPIKAKELARRKYKVSLFTIDL